MSNSPKPVQQAKWDRHKGRPEPIRLLNRIKEIESGDPLVYMPDACPEIRIVRPQVIPYVRKKVAEKLAKAAEMLPEGVHLGVIDAWRPIRRQQMIWDFIWQCGLDAFPGRDEVALRRTVCRWVAPTDQKAPPGHCTGAAIDVWLVDDAGEAIDVCLPYDRFTAAPTYSLGLDPEAAKNRTLLVETMLAAGFSNCRDEWWHYSYGDAGWAVRLGFDACEYGLIDLPEELYAEQERLSDEAFKTRKNPFLAGD